MFDVAGDWAHGPLKDVFGLQPYWILRIGMAAQFTAGLVIIVEIIGKDRIDGTRDRFVALLDRLHTAQPVRRIANGLWDTAKYFVLFMLATDKEKEGKYLKLSNEAPYDTQAIVASALLTISLTTLFLVNTTPSSDLVSLWWMIPLTLVISGLASVFFVYIVIVNALLLLSFVFFYPLEQAADLALRGASHVLARRRMSTLFLLSSLGLFAAGMFLEVLAS